MAGFNSLWGIGNVGDMSLLLKEFYFLEYL